MQRGLIPVRVLFIFGPKVSYINNFPENASLRGGLHRLALSLIIPAVFGSMRLEVLVTLFYYYRFPLDARLSDIKALIRAALMTQPYCGQCYKLNYDKYRCLPLYFGFTMTKLMP